MPRNIEIKAIVHDLALQHQLAQQLGGSSKAVLIQRDTFFCVARGRLKLREFADGTGELIQYERANSADAKTSTYAIVPVPAPALLREALTKALGVEIEVNKRRTLYLVGRTRIHIDEVEGLGQFIELEVVLGDREPEAHGRTEALRLMQQLQIAAEDLLSGAYADMLATKQTNQG